MKPSKPTIGGLLLACLSGCAGAPAVSPSATVKAAQGVTVSLLTERATPGRVGTGYVLPNDTLHSGDQLAFRVEVSRPAYVYVVWYSPDGWSPILFPSVGDQQLTPGAAIRVPGDGKWVPLDSHPSEESVYVLASTRSLAETDPVLLQQLRIAAPGSAQDRGETPTPAPPPPPTPAPPPPKPEQRTPEQRGPETETIAEGHKLWTHAGPDGVALLRLRFHHVP